MFKSDSSFVLSEYLLKMVEVVLRDNKEVGERGRLLNK